MLSAIFSFGPSASETSLSRKFGHKEKCTRKERFRHRAVRRSPPCDKPLLVKVSPGARSTVQKRCENGWERYFDSLVSGQWCGSFLVLVWTKLGGKELTCISTTAIFFYPHYYEVVRNKCACPARDNPHWLLQRMNVWRKEIKKKEDWRMFFFSLCTTRAVNDTQDDGETKEWQDVSTT